MAEYIYEITTDSDGVECYIKRGEVVRCKNCIHYDGRYCITAGKATPRHEDWWCADGEREVEE